MCTARAGLVVDDAQHGPLSCGILWPSGQAEDTRVPRGSARSAPAPRSCREGKERWREAVPGSLDPCSSRSLGCSQRRLEVDKAHLLQHMELGASCPQAAAGRARGAAPEPAAPARACPHPHAPVPCQDPSPPAAWGGTWALIRAGLGSWHSPTAAGRERWLRCRMELEVSVTSKGRKGPFEPPAGGSRDRQLVPLVPRATLTWPGCGDTHPWALGTVGLI